VGEGRVGNRQRKVTRNTHKDINRKGQDIGVWMGDERETRRQDGRRDEMERNDEREEEKIN
jgi:hypothetical protein